MSNKDDKEYDKTLEITKNVDFGELNEVYTSDYIFAETFESQV